MKRAAAKVTLGRMSRTSFAWIAPLALVLATHSCSYDWNVAAHGGSDANGFDADASRDASTGADSSAGDASAGDGSTGDGHAGVDAAPDCASLFKAVDDARTAAKKCVSTAGACTTHLQDPCNCIVVVAKSGTSEDSAYQSAVASLKGSGCPLGCGAPCSTARDGLCIIVNGGPETACSQ